MGLARRAGRIRASFALPRACHAFRTANATVVALIDQALAGLGVHGVPVVLERPKIGVAWRPRVQRGAAGGQVPEEESARGRPGDRRRTEAQPGSRAASSMPSRSPDPVSSTCASPRPHEAGGRSRRLARARVLRHDVGARRPPRDGRVRVGQSDRAAAPRPRTPGRDRRCARQPAGCTGLAGLARVLLQRRGRADRQPRAVGAGACARTAR